MQCHSSFIIVEMRKFHRFVFFFMLYRMRSSSIAEVEILIFFGDLTVETGNLDVDKIDDKPVNVSGVVQDIICEVTEQDSCLDILWFVGER